MARAAQTTEDSRQEALAGRLVETLGGRFSREMGIDVDRGEREVERWSLAATLFGTRISAAIAVRTYRLMARAGVRAPADVDRYSWDDLVDLLDRGGYVRYDYRTATRLQRLAAVLGRGGVGALRKDRMTDTRAALDALPGWGPMTVTLFLRELRGVWPGVDPPVDDRAAEAARHVGLLGEDDQPLEQLREVATRAGLDLRDLEASLVRLWLAHHREFQRCPGGPRCSGGPNARRGKPGG
ncbi:hypothetical protein AB0395_24405 [Streptosporangium sp. NPDC051023]|uniref:hypothetical protein n=1 Tax=Streptosporangium sp. NPDC051023 TaxID=3155410 RepID=UPI00344BCA74